MHAGPGAGDAALVAFGRRGLAARFLGQFELLAQFGQQFGGGPRWSLLLLYLIPLGLNPLMASLMWRAHLGNVRLVDGLDVLTPDRHHLEGRRRTRPTRRRAGGCRIAART